MDRHIHITMIENVRRTDFRGVRVVKKILDLRKIYLMIAQVASKISLKNSEQECFQEWELSEPMSVFRRFLTFNSIDFWHGRFFRRFLTFNSVDFWHGRFLTFNSVDFWHSIYCTLILMLPLFCLQHPPPPTFNKFVHNTMSCNSQQEVWRRDKRKRRGCW